MSAATLLDDLNKRGVRLTLDGDTFRALAGAGIITEAVKAEIAAHKPALLELLKARATDNGTAATVARGLSPPCPVCSALLTVEACDGWQHSYCPAAPGHFDEWRPIAPDHPPLSVVLGLPSPRRFMLQRGLNESPCCLARYTPGPRLSLICSSCKVVWTEAELEELRALLQRTVTARLTEAA